MANVYKNVITYIVLQENSVRMDSASTNLFALQIVTVERIKFVFNLNVCDIFSISVKMSFVSLNNFVKMEFVGQELSAIAGMAYTVNQMNSV